MAEWKLNSIFPLAFSQEFGPIDPGIEPPPSPGKYTFDGDRKLIRINAGVIEVDVRDLWSRWVDWLKIGENSKYFLAMKNVGGDPLPGSKELGLTYFLLNGWKIRPYEADHTLTINGNLYSDDGSSPYTQSLGNFQVMVINSVSNLVDSTVQQLPEIEYASYNGGVTIDTVNGTNSHVYPYGTPLFPCKTTTNSYMIRLARGFTKIYLLSDLNLIGIPDGVLNNLELIGVTGFRKHTVTISNVLITDCISRNVKVTGTCKNGSNAKSINCDIFDLNNANLTAENCYITNGIYTNTDLTKCIVEGDIKIASGGIFSGVNIVFEGDFTTIDLQNSVSLVSLDIDSGRMTLLNSVDDCLAEFNIRGGEMVLDASCIGGEFYAEGYGTLYNESTMTIKDNHLLALETIPIPIMEYNRDA